MLIEVRRGTGRATARQCQVPKELLDEWVLAEGGTYRLRAGQAVTEAEVHGQRGLTARGPVIQIGRDCFDELHLPWDITLHLRREQPGQLAVGPVVGVFVNDRYLAAIHEGAPPTSATELVKANRLAHTLVYWFSAHHVQLLDRTVQGTIFSPGEGRWLRTVLPLGEVLYDRGVNFTDDEKPVVQYLRRQALGSPAMRLVNSRDYFDKWWTHQALAAYDEVKPYLPATLRYRSVSDLLALLDRTGVVYLKSFYGSGGSQVMVVERQGDQSVCMYGRDATRRVVEDESRLAAVVDAFFAGRKVVAQEGVDLLQYRGRRMDMRILVNKDGRGVWEALYNQVRLARPGQRITNVRLGAEVHDFPPLVAAAAGCSPERAAEIDQRMRQVSVLVARHLEKTYGPMGEIGMDLALDRDLRIWFLEANAKPDKDPEPVEGVREVYPQFLYVLEYGKFLAGFHEA